SSVPNRFLYGRFIKQGFDWESTGDSAQQHVVNIDEIGFSIEWRVFLAILNDKTAPTLSDTHYTPLNPSKGSLLFCIMRLFRGKGGASPAPVRYVTFSAYRLVNPSQLRRDTKNN